ncbi:MAG: class I tRNA ligase family protein [Proteobacteria bacterium]|nr:class I tRNA ligase family protein [Pseudomonadota bacterium]
MNLLTQGMVLKDGAKMSKSKGNTVDPTELIEKYGADTVRLFMIFASPPEQSLEWSDSGIEGAYRFLKKLYTFVLTNSEQIINFNRQKLSENDLVKAERQVYTEIHQILHQANYDMERLHFNTVVSAAMKLLNLLQDLPANSSALVDGCGILLRLLSPITPHLTHYLWQELNFGEDIAESSWPLAAAELLVKQQVKLVIRVNGKLRDSIEVCANASEDEIKSKVLSQENIARVPAIKRAIFS